MSFFTSHFATLGHEFWGDVVNGLANGFIYAIVAIGYTMVYGVLRLINFAHSEIFTTGALASYFVINALVGNSNPSAVESVIYVIIGVVVGGIFGGAMAMTLERVAYRPLRRRNAPKLAYLISAIGASYFLVYFYGKEFGRINLGMDPPFQNNVAFTVFGAPVQSYYIVIFAVGVVMLLAVDRVVAKSKLGRGIRAVAQDAETAALMGVNIDRTIAITFLIGGFLGGAAGFLYAIPVGVVNTMGFTPAIKAFSAAVLGGIGNLRGAVLGGLILGIVEQFSVAFFNAAYIDVVAFAVLVLVLMFRPNGILGEQLGRSA